MLTLRDLYDIAAASVLARDDLEAALLSVNKTVRESLIEELRTLPGGWSSDPHGSGRPLIRPRRPSTLARDPGQCIVIFQELLAGDWAWADRVRGDLREEAKNGPGVIPE